MGGSSGAALEASITTWLDRLGLTEHADSRLSTLSRGLLQRVGLAQAFLSDPSVLLLDEPSASLDPEGQAHLETWIHEGRTQGKTCVMISQNLEEAARVATHIGILQQGRLADFREWSAAAVEHIFRLSVPPLTPEIQAGLAAWKVSYHAAEGALRVVSPSAQVPPDLLRFLRDHDIPNPEVTPQGLSLPEVYHAALQPHKEE